MVRLCPIEIFKTTMLSPTSENGEISQNPELGNGQIRAAEKHYFQTGPIPMPISLHTTSGRGVISIKSDKLSRGVLGPAIDQNYAEASPVDRDLILESATTIFALNQGDAGRVPQRYFHHHYTIPEALRSSVSTELTPVNNLDFLPSEWDPTAEDITTMVENYRDYLSDKLKRLQNDERIFYTPLFINGLQATLPKSYIVEKIENSLELLNILAETIANEGLSYLSDCMVIKQFCRGRTYTSHIPCTTTPKDFDSGFCDDVSNTSFGLGDEVKVFDFGFDSGWCMAFANGQMSFVPRNAVGPDFEKIDTGTDFHFQKKSYVGHGFLPVYTSSGRTVEFLSPGDAVLYNEQTGQYLLPESVEQIEPRLRLLYATNIGTHFVDNFTTLGQLQAFIAGNRTPYNPNMDCSSIIQRAFRAYGLSLPRYSGDISDEMERVLGVETVFTEQGLKSLKAGFYVAEMYKPDEVNPYLRVSSNHMFVVRVGKDGEITAHSHAFGIVGDSKSIEYPVGRHVCSAQGLLANINRGKAFRFHRVATLG